MTTSLRTKLVALFAAFALVMSLPVAAFATYSPKATFIDPSENVNLVDAVCVADTEANIKYELAKANIPMPNVGEAELASLWYFEGNTTGKDSSYNIIFSTSGYDAGTTFKMWVYSEYGDWMCLDAQPLGNGKYYVTVPMGFGMVEYGMIVYYEPGSGNSPEIESTTEAGTPGAAQDTGTVSPKTGVDTTGIAGASIMMLVAAAGVAVALRKKVTE